MQQQPQGEIPVAVTVYQRSAQGEVLHPALRPRIQVHTPLDAAVPPVVLSLEIGTVAIAEYLHRQRILALLQQPRHIEMSRKAAVLAVSGQLTVDPAVESRLHTLEIQENVHALPSARQGELPDVGPHGIVVLGNIRRIRGKGIARIRINRCVEPLQLPASGHPDIRPAAGAVTRLVEVGGTFIIVLGIKELPRTVEGDAALRIRIQGKAFRIRQGKLPQGRLLIGKGEKMGPHRLAVDLIYSGVLPRTGRILCTERRAQGGNGQQCCCEESFHIFRCLNDIETNLASFYQIFLTLRPT